jgi:hypothetical protein
VSQLTAQKDQHGGLSNKGTKGIQQALASTMQLELKIAKGTKNFQFCRRK